MILEDEMKAVAGNYYPCTDDGSYGHAGMVTTKIEQLVKEEGKKYDVCVAIGPMIMMKFVCLLTKKLEIPTIVSMNPIMVDGTGMCGKVMGRPEDCMNVLALKKMVCVKTIIRTLQKMRF